MSTKAWGGRFTSEPDELAAHFSASVDIDKRLADADIQGSLAHVEMLATQNIITEADARSIVEGLQSIADDIRAGKFTWDAAKEDVHMNIESELTRRIGSAGGRIHTARSRNDQVATDTRLWTREACSQTIALLDHCMATLAARAREHISVLMPGYTHLQPAQPVRLSHHLLAWCEMLERDRGRLEDAKKRLNESPLGAGALATTTFPIHRERTASMLGFERPMRNSLDAVSDRDFLLECVSALSICAVHLSRIAEELVIWSTQEFGFIEMTDAFTSGSSMMPQKKNPDMAELVRGKSGRVVGDLVNLLVLTKGLPLSYNRDLQEDKAPAFDAFDTVQDCLRILTAAMQTAVFREDRMRASLEKGFLNATELADYLAAKGIPFRQAHHVAGQAVLFAIKENKTLSELSLDELRLQHSLFDQDVYSWLDLNNAVERRNVLGGPARAQVEAALEELENRTRQRGATNLR